MAVISMLFQLAALVCGLYIMFTDSFLRGVALIIVVGVLHFVISGLTNAALFLHQSRVCG